MQAYPKSNNKYYCVYLLIKAGRGTLDQLESKFIIYNGQNRP